MDDYPTAYGLHFPNLSIQGFRGIKDLTVTGLGRVTLITGKNNTGKSSILEALRLHVHNAAPQVLYDILTDREEYVRGADEEERSPDTDDLFQVSALFNGFPRLSDDFGPIVISTTGRAQPMELTMRVGWFAERDGPNGYSRMVARGGALSQEPEHVAALFVDTEEGTLPQMLDYSVRPTSVRHATKARMPCVPVGPYAGERTDMLEHLWAGIALTEDEDHVVEALRIIDPRILRRLHSYQRWSLPF